MGKILLVEDDKSLREIYGVRLQAEGYEIVSAENGEAALASAIAENPDLIISDVMMPRISGFEMLDLLRGNEKTKNIKVIMMTALSSDNQKERGQVLGADRYLVKSQVGIEDLVAVVHEVLGDAANQGNATSENQTLQSSEISPNFNTESENAVNNMENSYDNFATNPEATNQFSPSRPAPNQSPINPPSATAPSQFSGAPMPQLPDAPMNIPTITNDNSAPNNMNNVNSGENTNFSQTQSNSQNPQPFQQNFATKQTQPNPNNIAPETPSNNIPTSENLPLPPVPTPDQMQTQQNQSPIPQDTPREFAAGSPAPSANFANNPMGGAPNNFSNNPRENVNAMPSAPSVDLTQSSGSAQNSIAPPPTMNSAKLDVDSILANTGDLATNNNNAGIFPNQN